MLAELEKAQQYIIYQFYVFRVDSTGKAFAEILREKTRAVAPVL